MNIYSVKMTYLGVNNAREDSTMEIPADSWPEVFGLLERIGRDAGYVFTEARIVLTDNHPFDHNYTAKTTTQK